MSRSMIRRLTAQLGEMPTEKLVELVAKVEGERDAALRKLDGETTRADANMVALRRSEMQNAEYLRRLRELENAHADLHAFAVDRELAIHRLGQERDALSSRLDAVRKAAIIHTSPDQSGAMRCRLCHASWDPKSPRTEWVEEWHGPICPLYQPSAVERQKPIG